MKAKKALVIINPVSGTRNKEGLEKTVRNRLAEKGIDVHFLHTECSGDGKRLARVAVAENFDMVIAAGGDGTVNEIASALAHTGMPLGILPMGSGNGLARSLGIPQDNIEALKIISEGHIIDCDRGLANSRPFYCTFGIGFDAAVSEKFASMKKRGRITYIRAAFREFLQYQGQTYSLSIGGKVITEKAFLIAVCNAQQYGNNAYIAPKAKLSDGLLDITVVHAGSPFLTMMMGVDLMTGYIDRNTRIETFQVKEATIARLTEGPVHLDGEPEIMGKLLHVACDNKALRVFAPIKETEFRPIVSPLRAMLDDMRYDVMAKFRK